VGKKVSHSWYAAVAWIKELVDLQEKMNPDGQSFDIGK
jgi:hypothetical protein